MNSAAQLKPLEQSLSDADSAPKLSSPLTADVSILIVNWNGKEMLRSLLDSIEANRGDLRAQTIVVDNASADASAEMVAEEFPQVRLIRNDQNVGFARANNQAAKLAEAPILILLNNDTVVLDESLQTLVRYLREHPDAIAVGPRTLDSNGNPHSSGRNLPNLSALLHSVHLIKWTRGSRRSYRAYREGGRDAGREGPVPQLDAACFAIRRSAFEKCGGFDEGYEFGVEDVDLCARLAPLGTIYYLPTAQIRHLGRVSSRANRNLVSRGYFCGWARYLRIHHGRTSAWFYKLVTTLDIPLRLGVLGVRWLKHWERGRANERKRTTANIRSLLWFTCTSLPRFWWS
ncbi:MAG: glycosyltransferase family 2 protein [Tepidisphaeraceae bacterium]